MKRKILTLLAVLAVGACAEASSGDATAKVDRDTLTRRQKDSIVSTMPLPGASRIRDAQKAVDKLNANAAVFDTVR